nr:hypothetical protein CFP56_04310 [Quercus suber]
MPSKHVVFDIVGTLVSFDAFYSRINAVIGPRLLAQSITPALFGYTWMTHAELEFTFLSMSGRHTTYSAVLRATFYRTLGFAGIAVPRDFATDEERDHCQEGYSQLELRDGANECISLLRGAGWEVWCLTTADVTRVQGYFARGGVEMPVDRFVSCDGQGVAKPALAAYQPVFQKFADEDEKWFAAAHMVGFKGAYTSAYEKDDCLGIFGGEMEIMADDLVSMAKSMIEKTDKVFSWIT